MVHRRARTGHARSRTREGTLLWVHLSAGVTGLGSATCGPGVAQHAQLLVTKAAMSWEFTWSREVSGLGGVDA